MNKLNDVKLGTTPPTHTHTLYGQNNTLIEIVHENRSLKGLLCTLFIAHFQSSGNFAYLLAKICYQNSGKFQTTLQLNNGHMTSIKQ